MFRHPKYYKELRKRNKEEARAQLKVPSSNLDQAISDEASSQFCIPMREGCNSGQASCWYV